MPWTLKSEDDRRRIEIRQKRVKEDLERARERLRESASRYFARAFSPVLSRSSSISGHWRIFASRLADILELQARPPLEVCGGSPVVVFDGFHEAGAGRRPPEPSATMAATVIILRRCDDHLAGGTCCVM
jgi:hypothetical protein